MMFIVEPKVLTDDHAACGVNCLDYCLGNVCSGNLSL
jgi:hypothetical protein